MSAAGFAFKGSGFYITDYGKDGKKNDAVAPKPAAPATPAATTEAKPAAATESKPATPPAKKAE